MDQAPSELSTQNDQAVIMRLRYEAALAVLLASLLDAEMYDCD